MAVLQNNPFLLASGSPTDPTFPVQRSVRIRSSASAYFNRTQTTTTNSVKCTFSGWVKRGTLGVLQVVFGGYTGTDADTQLYFDTTNQLKFTSRITNTNGAPFEWAGESTAVFRDPSAWYHIVVTVDTSTAQATNNAYYTVYVNNVAQTFTTISGASLVSAATVQNRNTCWNVSGYSATLGRHRTNHFDGYLTEVNFIDGQALTPSSFGGYNSGTGVWEPRAYTGTYGTNGFYLKFANPASIGADSSGNSNTWTANNIQTSNSALSTYDSMLDVPTNTSPTNANYTVLSPLITGNVITPVNANLQASLPASSSAYFNSVGTIAVTTGKWYWECTVNSKDSAAGQWMQFGIVSSTTTYTNNAVGFSGNMVAGYAYYNDGFKAGNGTTGAYGASYANTDVIGVAFDADNGTITFYKNGVSQGQAFSGISNAVPWLPIIQMYRSTGTNQRVDINFGQQPFAYTVPTGFNRLNTYNLPEPAVASSDDYHKVYTYTGNGGGLQVGEIQKPASLFNLDRSLRLRGSNSANFSRTPSSVGNRKTWTWSSWVKRGTLGTNQTLFCAGPSNSVSPFETKVDITSGDVLRIVLNGNSGTIGGLISTTAVLRDPNLWYHVVAYVDMSASGASNKARLYVNGVLQTVTTGGFTTTDDSQVNNNVIHTLGRDSFATTNYFDGYLADVYFIDGQALTPTDFGAYDGNYYWTPKAYTGTYGTNGFHLEFEDFSAATASAIGKDTSGQGNNWTPTGINVTTPADTNVSWDSMTDVPTLTSTDVANYCVIDPLFTGANGISNANLTVTYAAASVAYQQLCTFTVDSGKWYHEANLSSFSVGNAGNNTQVFGWASKSNLNTNIRYGWMTDGSVMRHSLRYALNGTQQTRINIDTVTPVSTDIFSLAFDISTGTITAYKNGTQTAQITGVSNVGDWTPSIIRDGTSNAATWHMNFGQRGFKYPVTGFKALNSFNVAEVTDDLESPDFVWIKSRSATSNHALFNSVTGVGKYLSSNTNTAETTDVNSLIQFNKNGFLLGNAAIVNTSAATYVAAAWKKGATQGFDVVNYTFTSTGTATINHSAGSVPKMILAKRKDSSEQWLVYHASGTTQSQYLGLNTTALVTASANLWGSTAFSSTQFYFTATNAYQYTFYVFAEIDGFSKFGSYLSNNDPNGPFVYTGFRPRWLMVKRAIAASGTGGWFMYDAARNTYNVMDKYLFAEATAGENTLGVFDFTSNGFKIRSNNVHVNTTAGDTYIYMAFAENPFKYALAR